MATPVPVPPAAPIAPRPASPASARDYTIWWFAFGYFAAYAPYSGLTKAITKGLLFGPQMRANQFAILPISVLASVFGTVVFLSAMRWWHYASHRRVLGVDLPVPTLWTGLSGVCAATIIMTTTLAYTFDGVSIVFIMLLMRGGVLVIAPVTDFVARRPVRWFSWVGLALSTGALLVADLGGDTRITFVCALDVAAYLASYFFRLRFMSRLAKSDDANANLRYFVEEQLMSTPVAFASLVAVALLVHGDPAAGAGLPALAHQLRVGFTDYWTSPFLLPVIVIGLLSQGTGIFGGLILLDRRENTFCVPVNRTSSILAGVLSSFSLAWIYGERVPPPNELIGAALVVTAILVLTLAPQIEKRRRR